MPTKASWHFKVPESIARLLKKQYLAELHDLCQNNVQIPQVTSLPIKVYGHPLLLGSTLDCHLKLMNSRKLAVTRASKVVSVLWVKGKGFCLQNCCYSYMYACAYAYFKIVLRKGLLTFLKTRSPNDVLAESASTATKLQRWLIRRWHSAFCLVVSTVLVLCSQTAVPPSESNLATRISCASFTVHTRPLQVLIVLCILWVCCLVITRCQGHLSGLPAHWHLWCLTTSCDNIEYNAEWTVWKCSKNCVVGIISLCYLPVNLQLLSTFLQY